MVNFTLRSTTNEMISIFTSQTFRSWVVIFYLRQPMGVFISQLIRYARVCSLYECFILRARRLSNRDTSWNVWNRHSGSFMVDKGILFSNMKFPFSRMLNDVLTLDQQWLPNPSDFPPISWHWYRLWPSPNYEWFPWNICNGCGMPAGNAYPSRHQVPSPHLWTCLRSNCWDQIHRACHVFTRLFTSNIPWYFLDFA